MKRRAFLTATLLAPWVARSMAWAVEIPAPWVWENPGYDKFSEVWPNPPKTFAAIDMMFDRGYYTREVRDTFRDVVARGMPARDRGVRYSREHLTPGYHFHLMCFGTGVKEVVVVGNWPIGAERRVDVWRFASEDGNQYVFFRPLVCNNLSCMSTRVRLDCIEAT